MSARRSLKRQPRTWAASVVLPSVFASAASKRVTRFENDRGGIATVANRLKLPALLTWVEQAIGEYEAGFPSDWAAWDYARHQGG